MSVKESGEEMADKFLVIDGSSLIHRAFFALPPLMTKQGVHTGAVYGFCNMLVKLLGDVKPKWLAVAFDKSRKTFRTEMFADYKGQRKPTPSELSEQFPLARRLLEAMNITVLETDGYEADDIIGTFAVHAPQNAEIIIVTGDKDELQLLDDRVKVYFTKRGISDIKAYDVAAFAADYEGLSPKQLIDLKGLMGDSSDNIPGVPGVGPKTALKLICEYGTVEKVLENIAQISGKSLKEKLENNKDAALLSKKLATIFTEVPVDLDLDKYELKAMSDEARPLMQELEFRNLHERFQTILGGSDGTFDLFGESIGQENANIEIALLETAEQGKEFFALLQQKQEKVAFTAVCGGELPKIHFTAVEIFNDGKIYKLQEGSGAWNFFYEWLSDYKQLKVTCDSKEIYKACMCLNKKADGIVDDIGIAAYLIEPGRSSYSLKAVAERYLAANNGGNAADLQALLPLIEQKLRDYELYKLYTEMELPLAYLLAKMELAGIKPDVKLLESITKEMAVQITALEILAEEQAGEKFNLKSPKQLGVLLFEKLGLPIIKKTKTGYSTDVSVLEQLEGSHPLITTILEHRKLTKLHSTYLEGLRPLINPATGRIHTHFQQTVTATGRLSSTDPNLQNIPVRTEIGKRIREIFIPGTGYSTDVSVLEQLEGSHPLITTILEHRKLTKLHSTYLEGLRPLINPATGRIHTHFQQTVTATGRLSSTDPNLQNIPVRTEIGKRIREIFIPGTGYDWLMSCDYSQVELRVLAHMAQDKLLLESFLNGQDVHARTAAEVFGVPLEQVDSMMRTRAKAVNFGIVYGISDFGLAKQLDISRGEAAEYIKNYFARYTGVKKYMDDTVNHAREQGYVATMFGRRRYLPDIRHSNFNLRSFAERTAINTPIQGTAADIIKIAMLKVEQALSDAKVKSRILLQVHDELVLEVMETEKELVAQLVKKAMESAASLSVPLTADVAWGKNWAQTK